ncbi:MAG: flagellar basal-body rod protein FlgG [Acidithiobacillus ferriphilus]|jgi:flagellar basal-body rod protein FlgG|uniref:flagellar basal-body rod protein FlgG n=1 Tax=Acidithiobacillus ferriphilus TaxID=1689834 RepID=UPI001C0774F5|nr:flagellar basal-body rod protein FlgG [Acidithiobacillus ferriphilus]MBU2829057.1 flagellar basal-body rod protein FlgG [Acidithiobacillus ferriphilus]MBU2844701.1 flagellar basal-body rod protein FlgG [Acidithiobacillus ferriphilus]MBU2849168.1 flagellar basal-body rod protein FlgG [Acidithiobacillus ferriphilus]MEB8476304.1 flagellar basal-body rod protein FlgG [Acidithiobacillus ferriphilus]MEB8535886.1 flagellar basal-body rod protein FlgG [Acidithiobacillus ferriphilus]
MLRALSTIRTGLEASQTQIDVIANNLANVGTTGFKRQRALFQDLLYQNVRQPGALSSTQTNLPIGLQLGTGVRVVGTQPIETQGNLTQTSDSLDLAVNGNGYFQVLMPNGTLAYTRDGSFQLNQNGQMVTANGYLTQPPITVPANATSITVAQDGTVTAQLPGQAAPTQIGQIQLATFQNPAGLQRIGDNLMLQTGASGAPNIQQPTINGTGAVMQGYLESSNVNVVNAMVSMITAQRAYQLGTDMANTANQMLGYLANI